MRLLCGLLTCLWAGSAAALTVTFENIDQGQTNPELAKSQGFLYDYTTTYLSGQHLYLHDDSGILESDIRREDGQRFSVHSIDTWGRSYLYKSGSGPNPGYDYDIEDVFWDWARSGIATLPILTFQGIRDGAVTAVQSVVPGSWGNVTLSSDFSYLDSLRVLVSIPAALDYFIAYDWNTLAPNTQWCFEWCASYQVDNMEVTLAPVPLPPSLPLMLVGLLGLGVMVRRAA